MGRHVKESDWKTFRRFVEDWRDRYVETTLAEIVEDLQPVDDAPTERFWRAQERMDETADILRSCFDGLRRSNMLLRLMMIYGHGIIDEADLKPFSGDVRRRVID
jgi:hypothetical protein